MLPASPLLLQTLAMMQLLLIGAIASSDFLLCPFLLNKRLRAILKLDKNFDCSRSHDRSDFFIDFITVKYCSLA